MLRLFVLACLLGGFSGFAGSVAGAAFGKQALFAGGILGGLLIAPLTARIAVWRSWIPPERFAPTALGAAAGFAAAAAIALSTLSSPIGPVLSTLLVGGGAVVGAKWRSAEQRDSAT